MIAIGITFLAGRYHGTGWDHHVNEGEAEWPPAPWRLLRALVAAGARLDPPPDPALLRRLLIGRLGGLPSFALPPAGRGHTRHYMPTAGKPTRVFDAFAAPGRAAELVVGWPEAALDPDEAALLDRLLDALPYLGRAESPVEARRLPGWEGAFNAEPLPDDGASDGVRLAALEDPARFSAWRAAWPRGRKPAPPADLFDALTADTATLRKQGWSSPPGLRFARWGRPAQRPAARAPAAIAWPRLACYAVTGPVLPWMTEAVQIGDRLRSALLSRSKDPQTGHYNPVFYGKDEAGRPVQGHAHSFYLGFDQDGDGRLDHLLVSCADGFDLDALRALQGLQRLWGKEGHDLHLVLTGLGASVGGPLLGPARTWISHTPFVLPRHPKRRGGVVVSEGPEAQLRDELARRGLPAPLSVERVDAAALGMRAPWSHFRLERWDGHGARGPRGGYGFRIRFEEPVAGPIALGHACHFGLGLFRAE